MIKQQILVFLLRWLTSSAGMWICLSLFGHFSGEPSFWFFIGIGLVFSLINTVVKPLLTMMALPLIIFTMGIVTVLINAAMVSLTVWLFPDVEIDFWGAVFSALIMSLVNTLVNFLVPSYNKN